jgi:hypothetical protein
MPVAHYAPAFIRSRRRWEELNMQAASNIEAKRGPLFGVMVLDFSRVLTGRYCTMLLAHQCDRQAV